MKKPSRNVTEGQLARSRKAKTMVDWSTVWNHSPCGGNGPDDVGDLAYPPTGGQLKIWLLGALLPLVINARKLLSR